MSSNIADIRKEYMMHALSEHDVAKDAMEQFHRWWNDAVLSGIDEVNAMTLATASPDGIPSARIVLLKGYDEKGFTFFTNYQSHKGNELAGNPKAALVFFWKELERQIRISGTAEQLSAAENDDYFYSRPVNSRIGAWASPQSRVIESRQVIEDNVQHYTQLYNDQPPRPEHWGGYRVVPEKIEFWQGRHSRLHDRIHYSRTASGSWTIERLAP